MMSIIVQQAWKTRTELADRDETKADVPATAGSDAPAADHDDTTTRRLVNVSWRVQSE